MPLDRDDEIHSGLVAALRNRNFAQHQNLNEAGEPRQSSGWNQKWRPACERIDKNRGPCSAGRIASRFF